MASELIFGLFERSSNIWFSHWGRRTMAVLSGGGLVKGETDSNKCPAELRDLCLRASGFRDLGGIGLSSRRA